MLKHHLGRDIQNQLAAMDEDVKQMHIACELTYRNLMRQIMTSRKRNRNSHSSKVRATAETRLMVFIDSNGKAPTMLASCAPHMQLA